jgi:hypothetical protein
MASVPRYAISPRAAEWRPLAIEWLDPEDESSPELAVEFFPTDQPYKVTVELRHDPNGVPFVLGVAVRCQYVSWDEWKELRSKWDWPGAGSRPHVSGRTVQRLPLARIVRAALAAARVAERPDPSIKTEVATLFGEYDASQGRSWEGAARKILVPRGRPKRGRSAGFYKEIAEAHKAASMAGKSPAKEIAKRKRVSENTVHQWIHRARRLGFLEPSPRSKRKEQESG